MDLEKQNKTTHSSLDDQLISKKMVALEESAGSDQVLSKRMVPDSSIPTDKNYFLALEEKAQDLFEKNLFSQAVSLLETLHSKKLGSAKTYSLMGCCYHQQNQFKKALHYYQQALSLNPFHLETLINLSILRFDLGDYKKATVNFKKSQQAFIKNKEDEWQTYMAQQHFNSGNHYYKRGYYHESLLEFLKSKPRLKKSLTIDLKIIQCLWKLNRRGEALQKLLDLKKLKPTSTEVLLLLGRFYFEMKRITFAILEWERVLQLDPKNTQALEWLSKTQDIQSVEERPLA